MSIRDELIELCDPWVTTIASDGEGRNPYREQP